MSLLDDIQNIDLGDILDARAGISASVSGGEVQVVIDGGAVTSALGPLGERLTAALAAAEDPAALMAPLLDVLTELLRGLGDTDLPIADLARAIADTGGSLDAIDLVRIERGTKVRDVTVLAQDAEHLTRIADAVRAVPGVDVEYVSDRTFLLHLGGKI